MAEEQITIPGGKKIPKKYLIVFGSAAALFVGYRWWTSRDTGTEEPTVTPPTEDYGATGQDSSAGYSYGGSGNSSSSSVDTTVTPVTNAQWTQNGVAYADSVGYDTAAAALALGKYLRSEALTATEQNIVKAVLAGVGSPPIGGPYTVITASTTTPTKLTAPTGLKVTATTANTVTLTWNKVTGATYYRVYRSGATSNVGATDGTSTSIVVSGLQPNTSYQFWVAGDTTSGSPGPISAKVTGKTKSVTLKAPTGVKATALTKSTVKVSWTKVVGATYYRIYVNGIAHGSTDAVNLNYVVNGLRANTTYSIYVVADTTNQPSGPKSATVKVKTKKS